MNFAASQTAIIRVVALVLPANEIDKLLPATFTAPGLSAAEFLEFCAKVPDAFVEYTADGTLIVVTAHRS